MSKKHRKLKRRIRRANRVTQQLHDNRHHLCFQRRYWEKNGYTKYLRNYFIFTIPVEIHNEYHHTIGNNIPIPEDVEQMAIDVRATQPEFTKVWMACWFLTAISSDKEFKNAMIEQYNFFAERNI